MLTFNEQAQQISNPQLIARTAAALVKSALAIMAEDAKTKGHEARAAYANAVLANPMTWAARYVWAIVSNPNAGAGSKDDPLGLAIDNDNAMQFIVNSVWNAYANYSPAEVAAAGRSAKMPDLQASGVPPAPTSQLRRFWRWLLYQ